MKEKNYSLKEAFDIAENFYQRGNISEAKNIFEKILIAKPSHFLALANLGIIFAQLKKFDQAISALNKALEINPNYAEGYNNLGNVFFELSNFDKSLECYEKAIKIFPNFSDAFNNLGNIYFKKGELDNAIGSYESAILYTDKSDSNKDKPYYNLGNIFRELENFKKSTDYYKKAINLNPNSIDAYLNLSISLYKDGNLEEAIALCENLLKKDPKNIKAINNLGEFNQEIGNEDLSLNYYKKALEIDPKNLRSMWLLMNTFPIIYKDFEQINFYKEHFDKNLNLIENLLNKDFKFTKKQILNALDSSTNFYLHYHGDNIINLQKRYGAVVQKLTKSIYPQFHKKIAYNKSDEFIKVGFVSPFFCNHVISKLFKNWIIKLNKKKFKTFAYHVGSLSDHITNSIRENSNTFFHQTNIDDAINQISADKLDILIFLDIGMVPKMQIIGSLRLAPVQCCAYGVPLTSGFENIDYFLTAESMEADQASEHYIENLIKIPDCGVDYDSPEEITSGITSYKKENDKTIFLNLQSNFKLLPQHDHIYFDIIKRNLKVNFWFISTKNKFVAQKFKNRISLICKENNLLLDDYFNFFPQTNYQSYLQLINKADIILDSLDWSGLNTSIDALNLNKPVITFPSNLMRGRHSYGILKILKINELITNSKKEYVDLALKLSTDFNLYKSIVDKIKTNKKILFNNHKTTEYLENFLQSALKDKKNQLQ